MAVRILHGQLFEEWRQLVSHDEIGKQSAATSWDPWTENVIQAEDCRADLEGALGVRESSSGSP